MKSRSFSDEDILLVARRCFLEQGPAVSTTTIAAQVGLSQAALFKRFATKRELMIRALHNAEPQWLADLTHGPDDRPVPEQMRDLLQALSEFFDELLPCMSVLSAAGITKCELFKGCAEPPPVRAHRCLAAWFRRLHDSGRIYAPDPLPLAAAFTGSVSTRGFMGHVMGEGAPGFGDDYLDRVIELFWRGIAPREPSK